MKLKVHLIAGARPNFMKIGPLWHKLRYSDWAHPTLVHTGQHYSQEMSDAFLADLGLPSPDYHLGAGSGSHGEQTAAIMVAYERLLFNDKPDWVIVVGDVNSTLACSISAKKLNLPVAHLEAGLRSGDRTMPEEINRIVTDAVADLFWTPSEDADANLLREGVPGDRIEMVGNIMIDAYEMLARAINDADTPGEMGLQPGSYGVVTLHRPSNVDIPETLELIVEQLVQIAEWLCLVFPVHPRTRSRLQGNPAGHRLQSCWRIRMTEPLNYIRFQSLVGQARLVITDSGGVQEETTYLGIPCLTVRDTTERPITVIAGTNRLIQPGQMAASVRAVLDNLPPRRPPPKYWDGRTGERVVASLRRRVTL